MRGMPSDVTAAESGLLVATGKAGGLLVTIAERSLTRYHRSRVDDSAGRRILEALHRPAAMRRAHGRRWRRRPRAAYPDRALAA